MICNCPPPSSSPRTSILRFCTATIVGYWASQLLLHPDVIYGDCADRNLTARCSVIGLVPTGLAEPSAYVAITVHQPLDTARKFCHLWARCPLSRILETRCTLFHCAPQIQLCVRARANKCRVIFITNERDLVRCVHAA